jgi:alkanesulfonate monooxygenase SsuD/methylene tetrahydromethanopterin reductase-like flavin-dependent oxidoreductase (luciferase family)
VRHRGGVARGRVSRLRHSLRLLFDQKVSSFDGQHFKLVEARCNPKPLQPRLRIWIGGQGEKRTLRAAARHADGWNAPYIDPTVWAAKNAVLDDWCAKEGRDPRAVLRSVNVGFYLGADAVGAARGEALYLKHWGANNPRGGFFRGTPKDVLAMCEAYQKAGVHRLNIALREGPYDWEALQAFAEVVLPAFGIRRPA